MYCQKCEVLLADYREAVGAFKYAVQKARGALQGTMVGYQLRWLNTCR